jgi:GDP-L-fucose synthase
MNFLERKNNMDNFYKNKNILVTGGTGLIGRPLVEMLVNLGSNVRIASLDDPSRSHPQAEFKRVDLTRYESCEEVCKDMDYVFHLAGIKGSPAMTQKKPASFFVPTILFNTNMMEAANNQKVKKYLFTSTVGVYSPAEVFYEDDVWKTFPSENDKFAGWAKRMGELQAQAYAIEEGWKDIAIVRPANVYGPYDKFNSEKSHVFSATITKVMNSKDGKIRIWGDGKEKRDLLYCSDIVNFIDRSIRYQESPFGLYNVGAGESISINGLVRKIMTMAGRDLEMIHDLSKPSIKTSLSLDSSKSYNELGWKPEIPLDLGIQKTIKWYEDFNLEKII